MSGQDPDSATEATSLPSTAPSPSFAFGPYRLLQRVGEGGMGEVWSAEQVYPLRRQVAIKVIKPGMDSTQVLARFEAERQALAIMEHPAIAKVFDAGTTPEGRPYFAMEFVRGEPITTYCDRQRLSLPDRLELFIHLCDGVQHAHQKGVIHRDLKPSNVLVTILDDRPVPKIIDFGVAKATAQTLTDGALHTEFGMLIGTPEYMSPEQAEMTGLDIDTRSDIYALGVLLYEILAGSLPFDANVLRQGGFDDLRRTIRDTDPPKPSTRLTELRAASAETARNRSTEVGKLAKQLRGDLDWITLKALEKDRTRRYQTANALALDVRRHLSNEPVAAGPPSAIYRTRKFVRRHRVGVAVAATLLAVLVSFFVVTIVQSQRIAREREVAEQVSQFLVGLFQVSDPSNARGASLTAREILATGAVKIQHDLGAQPAVQARLATTIGQVYTTLGLYSDAESMLNRAVQTSRSVAGDEDPATLTALDALGDVYWYQTKYDDAERVYLDVITKRTKVLGRNHRDTLQTQYDLASLYTLQKERWPDAERLGRGTLDTQRSVLGADDPDTIMSLNNLQALYFRQGRYDEALPLIQTVLTHRARHLGQDHPDTLRAQHNMATIQEAVGNFREAESLYRRVIDDRRRVVGANHPDTANTMSRFAGLLMKQERFGEAEPLLLSSYEARRAALGERSERVREVVRLLIQLHERTGNGQQLAKWKAKLLEGGA